MRWTNQLLTLLRAVRQPGSQAGGRINKASLIPDRLELHLQYPAEAALRSAEQTAVSGTQGLRLRFAEIVSLKPLISEIP